MSDAALTVPRLYEYSFEPDGPAILIWVWPINDGYLLEHFRIRGGRLLGDPGGWKIRRDFDKSGANQGRHYHCEKDGETYVVKETGHGSHGLPSGTKLPGTLGEILDELGVDLKEDGKDRYVRWLPFNWNVQIVSEKEAIEFFEKLLNARPVELTDGPTGP